MATGSGLGTLIPVAMTLAGVVTMLRARARRRRGKADSVDADVERRQAAAAEMERRMAAYLAGRAAPSEDPEEPCR